MTKYVDLHVHTNLSDGDLSPVEFLEYARGFDFEAISMCDHDTLGAYEQAVAAGIIVQKDALSFIKGSETLIVRGVELSASLTGQPKGTTHILAYNYDASDNDFMELLYKVQKARRERNAAMTIKLNEMGVNINLADYDDNRQLSRLTIAQILMSKGYASSISDAFERYIDDGKPAHVRIEKPLATDVVQIVAANGATPVLAHPYRIRCISSDAMLEQAIISLKDVGLKGIECYYPTNTKAQTENLLRLADKYELIVTGGSDFHSKKSSTKKLGAANAVLNDRTRRELNMLVDY